MIEAEEGIELAKSEAQFKREVLISPLQIVKPDLYQLLFDPSYVPPTSEGQAPEGVFYPTTQEEFEALEAEWKAADAERERQQRLEALAEP